MSIKALFPAGVTEVTVNGLHQWDYGRTLEVHDDTLPSLVEIHFACPGMRDAIVRPCAVVGVESKVSAAIPDRCLEQDGPVRAWVYELGATSGQTIRTITLPISSRPRPSQGGDIPVKVGDRYTELIGEVNKAVADIKSLGTAEGRSY